MSNKLLTIQELDAINRKIIDKLYQQKTIEDENPKVYTLTLSVKDGKSKSIDFVEKDGVLIDDAIIKFLLASFFQHE
jgi:hypothetical protein